MTDIVERLREYVENIRGGKDDPPEGYLCWQAADEIERLRQALERALEGWEAAPPQDQDDLDEIERLRHPKIIVGSRELWEAMGKIVSEAEIDEATLAAITAYDTCTRLPEDVMGYGPMRAALIAALPHLQNAALKGKADD